MPEQARRQEDGESCQADRDRRDRYLDLRAYDVDRGEYSGQYQHLRVC